MVSIVLLVFIPVSFACKYLLHPSPLVVFGAAALAVAVLANWVKRATEQLAEQTGPALGGLLNVSFGSIAELILALFVLAAGEQEVVRAQITGSIIGTGLLGLGLAALIGGLTRERQVFAPARAGLLASLLILVVIALLLPAIFDHATRASGADPRVTDEELSLGVSVVLLVLYGANLVYTLITHRGVFEPAEARGNAIWSLKRALAVLIGATVIIALESEIVADALQGTASTLHLSPIFLGVVVLALVGTSADLFAACGFARQDRMGLVLGICVGSAIQMALVVAPLLVLISWLIGHPMTLVFRNPLDLFAIAACAFTVNAIARDGETTWFEGLLLVGVYVLLALAFFFSGGS